MRATHDPKGTVAALRTALIARYRHLDEDYGVLMLGAPGRSPFARKVAALKAGKPVTVAAWEIPASLRVDEADNFTLTADELVPSEPAEPRHVAPRSTIPGRG